MFEEVFARRYSIGQLIGVALTILILGIILAVGTMFAVQMKSTSVVASDGNATAILDKVIAAFGTFADWINPLAFIAIASVVILILVGVYIKLRGATVAME